MPYRPPGTAAAATSSRDRTGPDCWEGARSATGAGLAGLPSAGATLAFHDLHGSVHVMGWGGRASGPPVVLVHGLGGSHLNWDVLAPQLRDIGPVLAVDLPGFGKSEPGTRRATIEESVAALIRFLEWLGDEAVVVGNSMGGMIALLTAAQRPDLVQRLVLLGPALPLAYPSAARGVTCAADLLLAWSGALVFPLARRTDLRRQVRLMFRYCGVDPDSLPPTHVDRAIALIREREDGPGMDKALVTAARSLVGVLGAPQRYWTAMTGVRCPVLLLHGEKDRLVPVSSARRVSTRLPHWTYCEYPAGGHLLQLERPEEVADDITRWLDSTPRRRRSSADQTLTQALGRLTHVPLRRSAVL